MNVIFFNLSVPSVLSYNIVILGLIKLFFEHRYHGKRFKFNYVITSLEYMIYQEINLSRLYR